MPDLRERAEAYLAGGELSFKEADELWQELKADDQISFVWAVLERMRRGELSDGLPDDPEVRQKLCQQQALFLSKDEEIHAAVRHDRAIAVLSEEFALDDAALDRDGETMGIAGGIYKRRWEQLGQFNDLRRAADFYRRGATGPMNWDAYAQVNSAFLEDLLADAGDNPDERRKRADAIRQTIVDSLPGDFTKWWNVASRAEALLGLGRYEEATRVVESATAKPEPWELETTSRQLATLVRLRYVPPPGEEGGDPEDGGDSQRGANPDGDPDGEPVRPFDDRRVKKFFKRLLGGAADAVRSASIGKVGLGFSGGGFRASFFHLGVLARLAELDVLRHVEVLSCVSGGSIVGACYWLELRRRLLESAESVDYVDLVSSVIGHFEDAVAKGLRERLRADQPGQIWRLLNAKGALDGEHVARLLDELFYRPLFPDSPGDEPIYMDQLKFQPANHTSQGDPLTGEGRFNPARHNWLRSDKVPALVLNATTVNTGHAWQFTVTWMGESPWSVHEAADTVPRLEWHWYEPDKGWRMPLGRAVAASAGVPGVFSPTLIDDAYEGYVVQLVDGGVYDNQGAAALLAQSCNVLLISDAAGQLQLEKRGAGGISGLAGFFQRSMETLMERIRQATYGDLTSRRQTGLLRGLMFVHMKEGLEASPIGLHFAAKAPTSKPSDWTPSKLLRAYQTALADLRTDLNVFTVNERRALMAAGYQMTLKAYERDLKGLPELAKRRPRRAKWPFAEQLERITSEEGPPADDDPLLAELRAGHEVPT